MKKRILCLFLVLALCLCLGTMFVACEEPPVEQPPVEDPAPETPDGGEDEPDVSEEGDKKGQFHLTPDAGGADVDFIPPNEQLPDSTERL